MKTKMIFFILLFGLLISNISMLPTNARCFDSDFVFDEEYTVTDALYDYQSGDLQPRYNTISKEDIEIGISGLHNLNTSSSSRIGGYTWKMIRMSTHSSYGILRGNCFKKVEAGVTTSKSVNASFSISGKIKGVELTGSFNFSTSFTYNGPNGTESVGHKKATHRLYSSIAYGKIMKYDYVYKDKYTGHIAKTKTEYYITNQSVQKYSNLVYINPTDLSLIVRSSGSSNIESHKSEDSFTSKINSTSPAKYIDF
ncbi:hypothetical protein [Tannockella kyphosi]|uniref:hypothetical protein n=1 Tax=Tannockella kyphosi TaxID=2899121 RepID=UPI00201287B9|nr:hypothetical protein [Tannockella kyphosi]